MRLYQARYSTSTGCEEDRRNKRQPSYPLNVHTPCCACKSLQYLHYLPWVFHSAGPDHPCSYCCHFLCTPYSILSFLMISLYYSVDGDEWPMGSWSGNSIPVIPGLLRLLGRLGSGTVLYLLRPRRPMMALTLDAWLDSN